MRLLELTLVAASVLSLAACDRGETPSSAAAAPPQAAALTKPAEAEADPHAAFPSYDIERVADLLAKKQVVAVDANSEGTRKELGTLPGAVLLSDSKSYAMTELPADKTTDLVFYCGSERCRSAPKAAERAQTAGYSNVHVMPGGIRGWVKAGKAVQQSS